MGTAPPMMGPLLQARRAEVRARAAAARSIRSGLVVGCVGALADQATAARVVVERLVEVSEHLFATDMGNGIAVALLRALGAAVEGVERAADAAEAMLHHAERQRRAMARATRSPELGPRA